MAIRILSGENITGTITGIGIYTAGNSVKIFEAQRSGGAVKSDWSYHDANTTMSFGTSTLHPLSIKTNDTERIRVQNTGNIGINNNNPTEILDISDDDGDTNIRVYDSSANSEVGLKLQNDAKTWTLQNWGSGGDNLRLLNNAGNIVQLWDDNGNVMIGNANDPEKKLHIYTSTTDDTPQVLIQNGSSGDASLTFNVSGQSYVIGIDHDDSSKFKIAASGNLGTNDRVTVLSTGEVGIGTISPQNKFVVANGTNNNQNIEIAPNYIQSFNRQSGNLGYASLDFYASSYTFNVADVLIGTNGKFLQGKRNTGSAVIDMIGFGAGTDRLQIKGGTSGGAESIAFFDTAGQMATFYNSNLGLGVTSPSGKLEVAGGNTLGFRLSNLGNQSAYDQVRMTYSGYNSGSPTVTFMPLTTPGSGNAYTTFLFQNTNGINASSNNNANVAIDGTLQVGRSKGLGETTLIMNNYDTSLAGTNQIQNSIRMSGRYWSGSTSQLVETRINSVHQESDGNGGSALTFWTQTGGDAPNEKLRIDKSGRVIVYQKQNISGFYLDGGNTRLYANGGGGTDYRGIECNSSGMWSWGETGTNNYFAKPVGIGTTPESGTLLHLEKNAGASTTVELLRLDCGENSHANSKGGKIVFRDINVYDDTGTIESVRAGGSSSSYMHFRLRNETIPTLTLNHNGSTVNIGENQTSYKLRVKSGTSSADNGIYVTSGSSSSNHALYVENNAGSAEHFAVRGDGQIRLNASRTGDVLFGCTALPSASVFGSAFKVDSKARYTLMQSCDSTALSDLQEFFNPNGAVGKIQTSGSATLFTTSSDYRLKEDLKSFSGLEMVSKIPVYDFKWKISDERSYGVMAHELQEVLPQAVGGDKNAEEMQSVDYSKIVPLLVKSIQELKAEIELLKNK